MVKKISKMPRQDFIAVFWWYVDGFG